MHLIILQIKCTVMKDTENCNVIVSRGLEGHPRVNDILVERLPPNPLFRFQPVKDK